MSRVKSAQLVVRMTPDMLAAAELAADAEGVTTAELARRLIDKHITRMAGRERRRMTNPGVH